MQLVEDDRAVRLLDPERPHARALGRHARQRREPGGDLGPLERVREHRRRRRARRGSARASPGRTGPRRSRARRRRPRPARRRPPPPRGRGPWRRTSGRSSTSARSCSLDEGRADQASALSSSSRNQKNPRGPKVRRYGSCPIGGNGRPPASSRPGSALRSGRGRARPPARSERGCGRRARCRFRAFGRVRRHGGWTSGASRTCRARTRGAPCGAPRTAVASGEGTSASGAGPRR